MNNSQSGAQSSSFNGQNTNNQNNQNQNQNTGAYNNNVPPKTAYPKKRSTGSIVVGIILVLMGTSYVVDKFLPWVFDWIDSGLVIAIVAIVAGFAFLVKK